MIWIIGGLIIVSSGALFLFGASNRRSESAITIGTFSLSCLLALIIASFVSSLTHSRDIGTVRAQANIITVYQDRVERLENRLSSFSYPRGSLLNADSPVASIVTSLSEAEKELVAADAERAKAVRSIAQRKASVFSFIVDWMGEE